MYKHILIPTDGSETADKAVAAGIEFAREAGARVTLFTAVPEYELPGEGKVMARMPIVSLDEHNRRSEKLAAGILASALRRARAAGVACQSDYAQSNYPYEAIIKAAERRGCDAIFMASHARKGLAALWHGSHTKDVLTHSTIPTLVYR
jgi:nucleotide-binding universal stress UspA family protein